jgi:UPF0176 protein
MYRSNCDQDIQHIQPEQPQMDRELVVVAAFYHFTDLPDYEDMRSPLESFCDAHSLKGTILLAREGINSTIAGSRSNVDALLEYLHTDSRFRDLEHKESYCDRVPFQRLKIRLKQEIIKLGITEVNPTRQVGTYVEPKDWNALINDPTVVVIDTRNQYEVSQCD